MISEYITAFSMVKSFTICPISPFFISFCLIGSMFVLLAACFAVAFAAVFCVAVLLFWVEVVGRYSAGVLCEG